MKGNVIEVKLRPPRFTLANNALLAGKIFCLSDQKQGIVKAEHTKKIKGG